MMDLPTRALRFLSSEVRGLHAAVYVLAIAAILSSLLALIRDRMLAQAFGASATLDIYYAAFRIPDIVFVAAAGLVSVYMLIPELARRDLAAQRAYIDTIAAGFSIFIVALSAVMALLAPVILALFFPEFVESGNLSHVVAMTRIMLLQPILLGLSNVLAAITQTRHRYALYALSPLFYNLGIIIGVTVLYPLFGLMGLAWGVVLGAFLHAAIQLPSAFADGFFRSLPLLRERGAIFHTASLSLPRSLALSMNQVAFFGLAALAALLPSGSLAVFMFAYNLQSVPLAIIGASYSVAAFPTLAAALSRGERDAFIAHVATAARYVLFWSLPASALILVLRAHIVRVILGSGAFDWTDTRLTAALFALFSLSLAAQGLVLLLVRGYYAAGKTFTPLLVAFSTAALTIVLGVFAMSALDDVALRSMLESLLRVEELPGTPVLGLAIAHALAAIVGAFILIADFERRFGGFIRAIFSSLAESIAAALVAGLGSYVFLELMSSFSVSSTLLSIFVQGFAAGIFGICLATATYHVLGSREYIETYASMRARLWRKTREEGITVTTSAEQ